MATPSKTRADTPKHPWISPSDLLKRFAAKPTKAGRGWNVCCPAHEDKTPSLHIEAGADGRTLLTCYAGCSFEAIISALGITSDQIGPRDGNSRQQIEWETEAVYEYRDSRGTLIYEVHRKRNRSAGKKKFLQTPVDQDGFRRWKMKGVTRLLYLLPELLADESNGPVFICEGEKCVEAVRKLGLSATCNSGGAGKWGAGGGPDYAEPLRGRNVVILKDADTPGRDHGEFVAANLFEIADSIKAFEMPGAKEGGDVYDWIQAGGTKDELLKLADNAPEWKAIKFEPSLVTRQSWRRLDVAFIRDWQCKPLRPIVEGILAHGNFVFVAAQSQTGKTLLGLYFARKILQGGQLFGKYNITPVERVLYLLLEDPDRRARDRILDTEHEFTEPLEPERFILQVAPSFTLTDQEMFGWLEQVIVNEKRDVVFIDTYQKATPGMSSFDDKEQGDILHKLANLARKLDVTIIVLDHFRKDNNRARRRETTIDDLKGTGGKAQNADGVILMERTPDREQIKFQAFSKDFDEPVRILLNVSPRGSKDPKFTYAADLEKLGANSSQRGAKTRQRILESMKPGEWLSAPTIARRVHLSDSAVKQHLKKLVDDKAVIDSGKGRHKRYCRIDTSIGTKSEAKCR